MKDDVSFQMDVAYYICPYDIKTVISTLSLLL